MELDAVASTSSGGGLHLTPPPSSKRRRRRRIYDVEDRSTKTDVGSSAGASWTLSSYKPGSGVAELRSADLTKLWQSDGNQPHLVNIQFARRTCVTHVSIYLDVKQDDSYTPTKIAIKAGTNYHDLTLVRQRTFEAPQGWKHFSMTPTSVDALACEEDEEQQQEDEEGHEGEEEREGEGSEEGKGDGDEDGEGEGGEGIKVWLLQVCILANHLNGKDTHIRRIIVFGPKTSSTADTAFNPLKRKPLAGISEQVPASKSHTNGPEFTLAQLLALQTQGQAAAAAEGEPEGSSGDASPPTHRSALNLFGSIR